MYNPLNLDAARVGQFLTGVFGMLGILTWREIQGVTVFLTTVLKSLPIAKAINVTEVVDHYLSYTLTVEKRSERTYLNRRNILRPFFKRLGIDDLKQIMLEDIDAVFSSRSFSIKQSTYSQERQIVKSFFEFCTEYREIKLQFDYHKIKRVKPVYGRKSIPKTEEIKLALKHAQELQDKLIIRTMVKTGMRIGEIVLLEARDISQTSIKVRGKGDKDRLVYMPANLANDLEVYCHGRKSTEKVFQPLQKHINHNNTVYTTERVRERIQRVFSNVGVKMRPHDLRHYFAVNWLLRGGDLRSLQLQLGHESIETTQIYLQLADSQVQENYKKVMKDD